MKGGFRWEKNTAKFLRIYDIWVGENRYKHNNFFSPSASDLSRSMEPLVVEWLLYSFSNRTALAMWLESGSNEVRHFKSDIEMKFQRNFVESIRIQSEIIKRKTEWMFESDSAK